MSGHNIFETTSSAFNESLALINKVDSSKFTRILSRIVQKIGVREKGERIFSEAEEEQLQGVLGLSTNQLRSIIEATSFILDQIAYYAISSNALASQLDKTILAKDKIQTFQNVWEENAEHILQQLKSKTVSPMVLDDIGWRFHLQMSQSSMSKIKQSSAIFEFNLKSSNSNEKMLLEFNREQLQDLYLKLEDIQEKLDTLS
ncbi:COMM domain-containing protein 10 [Cavenderia fasciculata]|uniref:COMM domain-containing protein 10 n=1 Tax=Cavenderia fasciculata TaxID=261658 RepID=F4PUV8_CACFS|nr:COMM domain-containing protein 10 [Cavenderia fasciculata]EGG21920.1 COMM domain-containing protein 10 [Cavenderia fasciculata]|eukprot:XP_004359771.1 COMM domain-containing protein 10 [Cavenderia fasciculata]